MQLVRRPVGLLIEAIEFCQARNCQGRKASGSCALDPAWVCACRCWDCSRVGGASDTWCTAWDGCTRAGQFWLALWLLYVSLDTSPCHCCCLDVCVRIVMQTEGCGLQPAVTDRLWLLPLRHTPAPLYMRPSSQSPPVQLPRPFFLAVCVWSGHCQV